MIDKYLKPLLELIREEELKILEGRLRQEDYQYHSGMLAAYKMAVARLQEKHEELKRRGYIDD